MEASGVVGAIRRRTQPESNDQDQQKRPPNAVARWRLAAGINFSLSKQASLHKPLRPQACPTAAPSGPPGPSGPSASSARVLSTRASSKRTITADSTEHQRQKAAVEPRPRSILDPTPAVTPDDQEAPSAMEPSKAASSKPEKGVAATVRGGGPSAGGTGADLILVGGRLCSTALPRSGSAPASSAITLTKYPVSAGGISTSSVLQGEGDKNRVPLLGGTKRAALLLEPGPNPAPTTLSCWDDGGDTINSVGLMEATTLPQRHGVARSWDGPMGTDSTAVSSQNGDKEALPKWIASASGAGRKDAPPVSHHDEPSLPLDKSAGGKRKQLLSPLRRRKSDITDTKLKRVHTARAKAAPVAPQTARVGRRGSDNSPPTTQLSQPGSGRLPRGNIAPDAVRAEQKPSNARQGATLQNLSASRPRTHAGRWGASSGRSLRGQAGCDDRVGQGQLKARTRVMEWKRRQSDGLKAKEEETVTLEQKEQAEAALEAARKLAATRAEEAERRKIAERENAAGVGRAADMVERWAKHSLERRRRRAEIYAINAIMRAAFEKDFTAYSLEKERQAKEASPIT